MPKLTVYIPDELNDRLEPFRTTLNLSEIARVAIEQRLREEEAMVGDRRLSVLTRLRRIEEGLRGVRLSGEDSGRRWAETVASWIDLKDVGQWPPISDRSQMVRSRPPETPSGLHEALRNLIPERYPPAPAFIPASVSAEPPDDEEDTVVQFWVGFRDGVRDVYALIKDDIEPPQ